MLPTDVWQYVPELFKSWEDKKVSGQNTKEMCQTLLTPLEFVKDLKQKAGLLQALAGGAISCKDFRAKCNEMKPAPKDKKCDKIETAQKDKKNETPAAPMLPPTAQKRPSEGNEENAKRRRLEVSLHMKFLNEVYRIFYQHQKLDIIIIPQT